MSTTASPGSDEAIEAGCVCPVMDNGHGRGYMGLDGVYVIAEGCPIHPPPLPQALAGNDEIERPM